MKLYECCDIGYCMGLSTIGECVDNVSVHATNLFSYDNITDELQELFKEVKDGGYADEDSVALVLGEDRMTEIDDEIAEWVLAGLSTESPQGVFHDVDGGFLDEDIPF